MRATAQPGGGMPGGGGFAGQGGPPSSLSDEERAAMRATAEAGGMALGGGRGPVGAGSGELTLLAGQVVELLAARAAQRASWVVGISGAKSSSGGWCESSKGELLGRRRDWSRRCDQRVERIGLFAAG